MKTACMVLGVVLCWFGYSGFRNPSYPRMRLHAVLLVLSGLALCNMEFIGDVLGIRRGPGATASAAERKAVAEFAATLEESNRATRVANRGSAGQVSIMSEADAKEMLEHYRAALAHAENADTDLLERRHPGLGEHFRTEALAGLRLVVSGSDAGDAARSLEGQMLLDSWGDWYDEHLDEIRKLR